MEAVEFLSGNAELPSVQVDLNEVFQIDPTYPVDFTEIKGQQHVKRAVLVAAAGGHNILMMGPPGSGKSMIAKRVPTILPNLNLDEAIETTKVYSISGMLKPGTPLIVTRPFRSPHHTISDAGLIGGGHIPVPGEVSLAHNGVLFLDELPEFKRNALEVLRQPMEDYEVTISRATQSLTFPANFMLAAAMNPCPCGYRTHPSRECACTPHQIKNYTSRISGPLLDRIDIHVEVPSMKYSEITAEEEGISSHTIREQVQEARKIQERRFDKEKFYTNAQMGPKQIRKFCKIDDDCKALLRQAIQTLGLSTRAHDKILKISRTIADLAGAEQIGVDHVSEAIQYRALDRQEFF
jgi:magnesium chelatase family protein